VADLSVKRQLTVRVAEALQIDRQQADLVLRGFYEEMLRLSNERLRSENGYIFLDEVGAFWAEASYRGTCDPATGEETSKQHWAYWFKPSKEMIAHCAEICEERS
jgi:hypothetical protein